MKKVITYGTFDLFHKGHYSILKRAKELGDYLIVGVTGDNYDEERGKLSVQDSLAERIENVKKAGFADLIIVEEYDGQKIKDIIDNEVDLLVLGLDWKGKFDYLKKYCEVTYLERTKDISSTQLRKKNNKIYNFGIVVDKFLNSEDVFEAEYVSGIHIESIYSEDKSISKKICEESNINHIFADYDNFLQTVDIVYIDCALKKRYSFIKAAILQNKHVISESPMCLSAEQVEELYSLSYERNIILLENIPTLFIRTFNQLFSISNSYVVGDIVSVNCLLELEEFSEYYEKSFYDAIYTTICVLLKVIGKDYKKISSKVTKENKFFIHANIELEYESKIVFAEFTNKMSGVSFLEIKGTKGTVIIPEKWWNLEYFKVIPYDGKIKRYSTNFEGNGFRFVVQSMIDQIKKERGQSQILTFEESRDIISIIEKFVIK